MNKAAIISDLEALFGEVSSTLRKLEYHQISEQIYAFSAFSTVFELIYDCINLIKVESYSSVPIVLRSALEAMVDLKAITKVENTIHYIDAAYHKEQLDTPNIVLKNKDEFSISQIKEAEERNIFHGQALSKLKAKGIKALRIQEKFNKVQLEVFYRWKYHELCSHAHHNITKLARRHWYTENGRVQLVIGKGIDQKELLLFISTGLDLIFESLKTLLWFLGKVEENVSVFQHYVAFCDTYNILANVKPRLKDAP